MKEISLAELQNQPSFQAVTISAKVLEIGDTKVLSDGRRLQSILVSDHTDNAELTLWESFVNTCELNQSYQVFSAKSEDLP